jgi:hypothetical protein
MPRISPKPLNTLGITTIVALVSLWAGVVSADEVTDCLKIKPDKARLACYDKTTKLLIEVQAKAEQDRIRAATEQKIKPPDPSALSPEQKTAAKEALKQLNKLAAATEVGLSYRDYGTRIVDVSGDLKEALNAIPESDLRKQMTLALGDYVRAREVWNALIISEYGEVFEKVMCPGLVSDYPQMHCSVQTTYSGSGRLVRASITDDSKARILSAIWTSARSHISTAEQLIAHDRLNTAAESSNSPAPEGGAKP